METEAEEGEMSGFRVPQNTGSQWGKSRKAYLPKVYLQRCGSLRNPREPRVRRLVAAGPEAPGSWLRCPFQLSGKGGSPNSTSH